MKTRKNKFVSFQNKEKELDEKANNLEYNKIILTANAFNINNDLSYEGYNHLKEQVKFISFDEKLEIIVNNKYIDSFKINLDYLITRDIKLLKKEEKRNSIIALILLIAGIIFFTIGSFLDNQILHEIFVVACWVFLWSAVEKWFFVRTKFLLTKKQLIYLACATIKTEEQSEINFTLRD